MRSSHLAHSFITTHPLSRPRRDCNSQAVVRAMVRMLDLVTMRVKSATVGTLRKLDRLYGAFSTNHVGFWIVSVIGPSRPRGLLTLRQF
jgi:hypothetical protein